MKTKTKTKMDLHDKLRESEKQGKRLYAQYTRLSGIDPFEVIAVRSSHGIFEFLPESYSFPWVSVDGFTFFIA